MRATEQVVADWYSNAQAMRACGDEGKAQLIEKIVGEVAESAEEYLRFVPESDASLMSGKSVKWLRGWQCRP